MAVGNLFRWITLSLVCMTAAGAWTQTKGVQVIPDPANRKVDVLIGGQPFTSYIYPATLKKPVLFPLRTSEGALVTRGFPPEPGERKDHPHHAGLWFNYGNVNGIDFWNNSDAIKPQDRDKMGTIVHRGVIAARNGPQKGELEVESDWLGPDGKVMLREHTVYVFRGSPGMRSVDRITTLTALDRKITFTDDKEGVLGLRVTRALELPSEKPETFTDTSGRETKISATDNSAVTGDYLTSEGKRGAGVWGTRGRWCSLSGRLGQQPATITILDHPRNPGFPTYWHARGYGLFAANPLGEKVLSGGKEELNFALAPGSSVTFRHRVVILSEPASSEHAEKLYKEFVAAYP
jgi:Methane oxygenase PmoA